MSAIPRLQLPLPINVWTLNNQGQGSAGKQGSPGKVVVPLPGKGPTPGEGSEPGKGPTPGEISYRTLFAITYPLGAAEGAVSNGLYNRNLAQGRGETLSWAQCFKRGFFPNTVMTGFYWATYGVAEQRALDAGVSDLGAGLVASGSTGAVGWRLENIMVGLSKGKSWRESVLGGQKPTGLLHHFRLVMVGGERGITAALGFAATVARDTKSLTIGVFGTRYFRGILWGDKDSYTFFQNWTASFAPTLAGAGASHPANNIRNWLVGVKVIEKPTTLRSTQATLADAISTNLAGSLWNLLAGIGPRVTRCLVPIPIVTAGLVEAIDYVRGNGSY